MPKFYGKYRGKVIQNVDPMQLGRVMVNVPTVMGPGTNWAMPGAPVAGIASGIGVVGNGSRPVNSS